jgi:hypothetical protein
LVEIDSLINQLFAVTDTMENRLIMGVKNYIISKKFNFVFVPNCQLYPPVAGVHQYPWRWINDMLFVFEEMHLVSP